MTTLRTETPTAPRPLELEDRSSARVRTSRAAAAVRARGVVFRCVILAIVIAAWLVLGARGALDERTFPPLPSVIEALVQLITSGELAEALPVSLGRALLGFTIGAAIALSIGLLAGLFRPGEELIDVPMQAFRAIPFFALLPLFVTWFGIAETSKTVLIVCAVIPPVYINTFGGARGVDRKLIEAARAFRMSSYTVGMRIILPTAMPSIITGLRYASSIALLALVIAEQLNSRAGLGFIMTMANRQSQLDVVVAVVLVYAVLGILVDLVWRVVEKIFVPWQAGHVS